MIHLDIMDGHFVPNLSFGPQTVSDLLKKSQMFFDAHLMLERPDLYIDPFIEAGSNLITIHTSLTMTRNHRLRKFVAGLKTGMAINPETPIDGLLPFLVSWIGPHDSTPYFVGVLSGKSWRK